MTAARINRALSGRLGVTVITLLAAALIVATTGRAAAQGQGYQEPPFYLVVGLVAQALVLIGILVKMVKDAYGDGGPRAREATVRQAEDEALRVSAALGAVEARVTKSLDKAEADIEVVRRRLHDVTNEVNVTIGRISSQIAQVMGDVRVVEERTRHQDNDLKRLTDDVGKSHDKLDKLLSVMSARASVAG